MTKTQRRRMQVLATIMVLPILAPVYIAGLVWHTIVATFEAGVDFWQPPE